MAKKLEPIRKVHPPWVELDHKHNITWSPKNNDTYGGGRCGPSSSISQLARTCKTLADLFFFVFPITLISYIAKMSNKYAYEEWVVEKERVDRHGNTMKTNFLVTATKDHGKTKKGKTKLPPGARHRADKEPVQYPITTEYVMAFLGILVLSGALLGERRNQRKLWRAAPYGLSVPCIRNTMPRNSYEFMRRYIHFTDNSRRKVKGEANYDPLYKVRYVMEEMMKGMRKAWIAGKNITIDESMLKYMGRAISFVMYMPLKPIKHGIKVFCVCCAYTAVLLGFEIFVGAEDETRDNSTTAIVDRLITDANLVSVRGRTLFTDNWYTSVPLAKLLFDKYGWTFCGTIVPTDKKQRADEDVPFLKLSNGALLGIDRGWFREAALERKTSTGKKYFIQCTSWRDKKQVMFLHSTEIGRSHTTTKIWRYNKSKRRSVDISAPRSQQAYVQNFNAVDRNDRDSAEYTTSIRTNRYYLRIFCWVFDRVIHCLFVVVCFCARSGIGDAQWQSYLKDGGREEFQIDLGIAILNAAIERAWDGKSEKPRWMRRAKLIPCDCNKCYFCLNGMTNGIHHKAEKVIIITNSDGTKTKTTECTDERVTMWDHSQYCRMCYRQQSNTLKAPEKRKFCKTSRKGCPVCEEPICKECWDLGYDQH